MTALEQAAAIAAAARRYVRALAAVEGADWADRLAVLYEEADALHALTVALGEPCPLCATEDCPYAEVDGEPDLEATVVPDPGGLLNQA